MGRWAWAIPLALLMAWRARWHRMRCVFCSPPHGRAATTRQVARAMKAHPEVAMSVQAPRARRERDD